MADKKYKINFEMSDGSTQSVEFTAPQGDKGDPGKTAYQYAQEAGFVGTEEEFAELLAGNSIKTWGAVGDGVADDTVAFQNALENSRVVKVPGGTYKLNGTLVIRENCCLELSQDTVLEFEQTSGNCIEMRGSANLRGNHAIIIVPYAFTGNVIDIDTLDDGTDHATSIPPYTKSSPMFKRQRFIYDVNIIKPIDNYGNPGFCESSDGKCTGKGIYISATNLPPNESDGSNVDIPWMWALTLSGIRIAGGFSYGIHAINFDSPEGSTGHYEDDAWNHDMRIEAVIASCEIGVALENCNGAHLAVTFQPSVARDGTKYAKHGVYLNDAKFIDMIGSRIWDWNGNNTLWTSGGQYQHIAMIGNCRGLILDDFLCHETATPIRELIYTDTAANFDKMTILQEPGNKYFKAVDGEPYFNDGNSDKRLAMKSDIDEYFQTDRVPDFIDVLAVATDKDGSIFNGIGYKNNTSSYNSEFSEEKGDSNLYLVTGFVPVKAGDTLYGSELSFVKANDGDCRIALFDASHAYITGIGSGNLVSGGNYFVTHEGTDDSFKILIKSTDGTYPINTEVAYARLQFLARACGDNPVISVNEEIKYTQAGFLADSVKVKAENVVGSTGGSDGSAVQFDWNAAEGEPGHILNKPEGVGYIEMEVLYDGELSYSDTLYHAQGFIAEDGETYTITWNGTPYTCTAKTIVSDGVICIVFGNAGVFLPDEEQTGEPFVYSWDETSGPIWFWIDENGNEINDANRLPTATIEHHKVVKVPTKFIDKVPFIDLADFGLPAVEIGGTAVTSQNGVDELRAIMQNGHFKYKVTVKMGGANIPLTVSASPICAELLGMYQAYTLTYFNALVIVNLWIAEGSISLEALPLSTVI